MRVQFPFSHSPPRSLDRIEPAAAVKKSHYAFWKMQPDDARIFLVAGLSQSTLSRFDAKQA